MRYFLTTNASLPVNTPAGSFIFEPCGQQGGSWFGVLAVADEAAASSLVGASGTDEITVEHYDRVKKKTLASPFSTPSVTPPASPQVLAAPPAADPTSHVSDEVLANGNVVLKTTTDLPPVEPLLEEIKRKRGAK